MIKFNILPFAILWIYVSADNSWNVDWSQVQLRSDAPGFWEGRWIQPEYIARSKYDRGGRIVGGWEVNPHAHPYQAGLLLSMGSNLFLCGGSAIHIRAILTAAHCIESTDRTQVVLGAHRLQSSEPSQQRFNVSLRGYRPHPQYDRRNFQNDISILILDSSIEITSFVQLIALPRSKELRERSFERENATVR